MTMSGAGTSAAPGETSSFYTALEECLPSGHDIALGDCSGAGSSMEQTSEYFSRRVEEIVRSKSQFSSDVEHEIEASRVHWSEVTGLSELSDDPDDLDHFEEINRENREVFAELMNDPQWRHHERGQFFREWGPGIKLGWKIAQGGQAEIFVVLHDDNVNNDILLKVFSRGSRLSYLQKQWPRGILRREVLCIAAGGTMLDDGRFAFLVIKCWGDLRKLIEQAMREKNNQGPPFPYEWNGLTLHAKDIMRKIAIQMKSLHEQGILHRDLKSPNILLKKCDQVLQIIVADFECSIGVLGTGWWRAPEILLGFKNKSHIGFSEKADVYSYGMTCFEVVSGLMPFEGELDNSRANYDLIIAGQRPKLPSDLDLSLKDLIERCWNPIPDERPSFAKIESVLSKN